MSYQKVVSKKNVLFMKKKRIHFKAHNYFQHAPNSLMCLLFPFPAELLWNHSQPLPRSQTRHQGKDLSLAPDSGHKKKKINSASLLSNE